MATNFVNCSYQEIIDLHTESDHVTVLGVHTPTGSTPRKMFSGFFDQFKKYKYNGCSIKLVPAARLPVDPLQVGVEPGQVYETPMDPRDALNPIMFHGCHGNDMGEILDMLYGSQDISESMKGLDATTIGGTVLSQAFYDVMERLYYKALTDNTWKKAHPQRGFKKAGLRPLVYSVAANRQISPGALGDVFSLGENDEIIQEMGDLHQFPALNSVKVDKSNLQFFTPRLTSLGWMDTRNALTTEDAYDGTSASLDDLLNKFTNYSELPSIFMGCILLPPAYGVEQYFRMIINHSFSFKNFRGISFKPEVSSVPSYYDANADLFDPEQYEGGGVSPTPDPDPPTPPVGDAVVLSHAWGDFNTVEGGTQYNSTFIRNKAPYVFNMVDDYSIPFNLNNVTWNGKTYYLLTGVFNDNGVYKLVCIMLDVSEGSIACTIPFVHDGTNWNYFDAYPVTPRCSFSADTYLTSWRNLLSSNLSGNLYPDTFTSVSDFVTYLAGLSADDVTTVEEVWNL